MNAYSVAPFSGKDYQKNSDAVESGCSCAICGKRVEYPFKHYAVVVEGGDKWAETEEEANSEDSGNMGLFGIGPECHRKYLVK